MAQNPVSGGGVSNIQLGDPNSNNLGGGTGLAMQPGRGNDISINDPGPAGEDKSFDFDQSMNNSMNVGQTDPNIRGSMGPNGNLAGGQNTAAYAGNGSNASQALAQPIANPAAASAQQAVMNPAAAAAAQPAAPANAPGNARPAAQAVSNP